MSEDFDILGAKYLAKAVISQAIKDITGRVELLKYDKETRERIKADATSWVVYQEDSFDLWSHLLNQEPSRIRKLIMGKCGMQRLDFN
jgi:hypothetical protein